MWNHWNTYVADGNVKCIATTETSSAASYKVECTLKYSPEKWNYMSHEDSYTNIFSSFNRGSPKWKKSQCPLTGECINKLWYVHTMRHNSVTKRNELVILATTWMNLKILYQPRNQTRKSTMSVSPLIWNSKEANQIPGNKKQKSCCFGPTWRGEGRGWIVKATREFFGMMEFFILTGAWVTLNKMHT